MRRRGYAVVFALVLLAALVGGFVGGRFLSRRLQADFGPSATWTPPTPTAAGVVQPPTVTPFPVAQPTRTPTRVGLVVPTPVGVEPIPTVATSISPTEAAPSENSAPSDADMTPTPTSTVLPDAPPTPAFQFALVGNVKHTAGDCPGSYILGQVSDRAGKPLPDVQLLLSDEYGNQERKMTKSGADAGRYDFPLFPPPRRFFLTVVDASGRPLSAQVEIAHGVGVNPSATCHWVYWRQQ